MGSGIADMSSKESVESRPVIVPSIDDADVSDEGEHIKVLGLQRDYLYTSIKGF